FLFSLFYSLPSTSIWDTAFGIISPAEQRAVPERLLEFSSLDEGKSALIKFQVDRMAEMFNLARNPVVHLEFNAEGAARFGRTLNTSITTLLALIALLLIGGASIKGFATTLTIGCIVGTYSSIFIASPVLFEMTGDKLKN
ncbi:MAG: hypothetical protein GX569_05630, partial [Candidatus Riflebacteria bacterium]|nr:hypothetical protein [Candidatus Riflebacteria bacterium]